MIRLSSILLAVVISFQVLQKTWIVLSYHIHQDFIAANLCENKLNPASNCKGKCYLKKQLQSSSDEYATSSTMPTITAKVKVEWSLPMELMQFVFQANNICPPSVIYMLFDHNPVTDNLLKGIFRPPCFIPTLN